MSHNADPRGFFAARWSFTKPAVFVLRSSFLTRSAFCLFNADYWKGMWMILWQHYSDELHRVWQEPFDLVWHEKAPENYRMKLSQCPTFRCKTRSPSAGKSGHVSEQFKFSALQKNFFSTLTLNLKHPTFSLQLHVVVKLIITPLNYISTEHQVILLMLVKKTHSEMSLYLPTHLTRLTAGDGFELVTFQRQYLQPSVHL